MAILEPIYRATFFAPGSQTVVFTPAGSAPHSDEFKIATTGSIAGFEPFMTHPKGRKSRFDPVKAKLDIGAITFNVLDKRTDPGGSNFNRFATAMIGDDSGKARMLGLKVAIEESINGGSTFSPYYVGRVSAFNLVDKLEFSITVKEDNDLQKTIQVFEGEATASLFDHSNGGYANRRQCMPYGPDIDYGSHNSIAKAKGTWRFAKSARNRAVKVRLGIQHNQVQGRIWLSKPLYDAVEHGSDDAWKMQSEGRKGPAVVRVSQGGTVGRFYITYIKLAMTGGIGNFGNYPHTLHSFLLEEIESDRFEYLPLTAFADDSNVDFAILFEDEPTEKFPLLLDDVHPVTLWRDLLLCKHSRLNNQTGQSLFSGSIDIDVDAFDELISDFTFRRARFRIKEPEEMSKFIENSILKPYQLGYYMQPFEEGGRFGSKVVPFSMALPTSLDGIQTITQDDLKEKSKATWIPGKAVINFETTWYAEKTADVANLVDGTENHSPILGPENPTLVSEFLVKFTTLDLDNVHGNGGNYKVDARGIRYLFGELYRDPEYSHIIDLPFGLSIDIGWPRQTVMQRLVRRLHDAAHFRWGRGPATVTLLARRVAATTDLNIGDYRIIDVDWLPGSFSHTRGTARLMQCVERSEDGPNITFRFIDSGQNIQRATPTLGAFSQIGLSNTGDGLITVGQAGRVETFFAVTGQSVITAPAATSSLWVHADIRDFAVSESKTITVGEFPDDSRIWVKANIKARSQDDFDLPSEFGFADPFDVSTTLDAPSDLTITNLAVSGGLGAWTNGNNLTASIEVRFANDNDADLTSTRILPPGTTQFPFNNRSTLAENNPQIMGVRHVIRETGTVSLEVTASFDLTGAVPTIQAPTINAIIVIDPQIGSLGA